MKAFVAKKKKNIPAGVCMWEISQFGKQKHLLFDGIKMELETKNLQ